MPLFIIYILNQLLSALSFKTFFAKSELSKPSGNSTTVSIRPPKIQDAYVFKSSKIFGYKMPIFAKKMVKWIKEPVKTEFGYHIILKTKEYEKKQLEEVKDEILDILAEEKIKDDSQISEKALIALREDNGLVIEDSTLKTQYENYKYNYE